MPRRRARATLWPVAACGWLAVLGALGGTASPTAAAWTVSKPNSGNTFTTGSGPAAPATVSETCGFLNSLNISWSAVTGASSYTVWYSTTSSATVTTFYTTVGSGTTSINAGGLGSATFWTGVSAATANGFVSATTVAPSSRTIFLLLCA